LLSLSKGVPEALLHEIVILLWLAFFVRERPETKSRHAVKRDG